VRDRERKSEREKARARESAAYFSHECQIMHRLCDFSQWQGNAAEKTCAQTLLALLVLNFFTSTKVQILTLSTAGPCGGGDACTTPGTHITCFISTNIQILTPQELLPTQLQVNSKFT
jgi:hypothetical protein